MKHEHGKSRAALPPEEWDFRNVPDEELSVCRLWEYARESQTIRNLCERTWKTLHDKTDVPPYGLPIQKEFDRMFGKLGRAAILFQEGIYGFGGTGLHRRFSTPFPQPWQALSPRQRAALCETANWDARNAAPTPVFRRAEMPSVELMAERFKPKSIAEVFGKERPDCTAYHQSGHKLRAIFPNLLSSNGNEVLAVQIDWHLATNEELIAAFREWVKENEPPGIKRPDRRGCKASDLRAALDWLGMLRLLHVHTRAEMSRKAPEVEKLLGSRDWYRDRKRAGKEFRKLLSFLPANEKPLSWITQGSRRR